MNLLKKTINFLKTNFKTLFWGCVALITLSIVLLIYRPLTLCPFRFENINFIFKTINFFWNAQGLIFLTLCVISFFFFFFNLFENTFFLRYNNLIWKHARQIYLRTLLYPHYWLLISLIFLVFFVLFFSFSDWLLINAFIFGHFSKKKHWRFVSFLGFWINSALYWTVLGLYNCVWQNKFFYWACSSVGYVLYSIVWMSIDKINSMPYNWPKLFIRPKLFILKKIFGKTLRKKLRTLYNTSQNYPIVSRVFRIYHTLHLTLWLLILFTCFFINTN